MLTWDPSQQRCSTGQVKDGDTWEQRKWWVESRICAQGWFRPCPWEKPWEECSASWVGLGPGAMGLQGSGAMGLQDDESSPGH